ncbi:peptide chain release factor 1 [Thermotoga sp. Ku-13t]|uniref:peptide chain release factor 1 n=1 Tax=Thermotoga sp. Ku-13t TaxID=1755813 RepID=UPI0013EAF48F|nr:peptide chain release factor 1 [Thermotoga sp. Ku-13t]KAF2957196.1 peptide chain release factor 1 [Thermotoga sp. Ku-13t]
MKELVKSLVEKARERLQKLQIELARTDIDVEEMKKLSIEYSKLEEIVQLYEELEELESDIEFWQQVVQEDPLAERELTSSRLECERKLSQLISLLLPSKDYDSIIMEIRAGTGGEEAALFAADLYRMYTRYAERKGWQVELADFHDTELGGFKEVVLFVRGKSVYKYLKWESGVHRVQRVPITESSGRIHTSTATVAILPEVSTVEVQIDLKDIEIDTFKASGHGGQYVNKTESAVRVTHIPTGIVVSCQSERSQHQNKERALAILRAKLFQLKQEELMEELSRQRKSQIKTAERSEKIRTYNFPQNRVTDHRIDYTSYRLKEILDGDLDELVSKLLEFELAETAKRILS